MSNEWKELKGIGEVAEAVAAGMEIQVQHEDTDWFQWPGLVWNANHVKYRARPRKPAEPEQDWIDRLAGQYGVKQAATLRGDTLAISKANHWLMEIAHEHWHEIIAALRKEQESAKSPAKVQVKSLCWREAGGNLTWRNEGAEVAKCWERFPAGDIEGEVEA